MAKISGGVKNSRLWAFSSAKKVLLTAEKVGIGPQLAKISGGVKPGHLEEGEGPKYGQNLLWGRNIENIRGLQKGQNSIWGKTGHL